MTRVKRMLARRGCEWPDAVAACPSGTLVIGCMYLAGLSLSDVAAVTAVERDLLALTIQMDMAATMSAEVLTEPEFVRLVAAQAVCAVACAGQDPGSELLFAHRVGCDLDSLATLVRGAPMAENAI
jgi:hypothetical protein